ncbi:hypothetical protein ACWD1Z_37320, partial [Streptomyces sp. NPDC002784]
LPTVNLYLGTGCKPGSWMRGGFEFRGVDQGEEIPVTVEEGAVHPGLPGDASGEAAVELGVSVRADDDPAQRRGAPSLP